MGVDDLSITSVLVDRVLKSYPREILEVHREDTLIVVSREFERKRTAIAMVVDDEDRLLGTVSLGDIVHAIGEHGAGALYLPVRMIMSYNPVTCEPKDTAENAARTMSEHGVKHLPVVDRGKLVGCIEHIDVLEDLYSEAELDFNQLRNYIFKTGGRYYRGGRSVRVAEACRAAFPPQEIPTSLRSRRDAGAVGGAGRPHETQYTHRKRVILLCFTA